MHVSKPVNKRKAGLTLLEAVIALALWGILSTGVFLTWHHISRASQEIRASQSAFENARVAMDALIMNMQMAWDIELITGTNDVLQRLTLWERDPQGRPHAYRFYFDINALPGQAKFQRLEFGTNNEFAANIAVIRITYVENSRMNIFIETGCEFPVTLTGSVDVRYKNISINP